MFNLHTCIPLYSMYVCLCISCTSLRDTIGTHAHCLYRGEKEKRKKKKEKRKEQENTAYSYVNRGGKRVLLWTLYDASKEASRFNEYASGFIEEASGLS